MLGFGRGTAEQRMGAAFGCIAVIAFLAVVAIAVSLGVVAVKLL